MLPIFFLLYLVSLSSCYFNLEEVKNELLGLNITESCKSQFEKMDLFNQKLLAKMFDSSSKIIPSGMISGNFYDLAFYDECIKISDNKWDIYGKYCLASIKIPNSLSHFTWTANHTTMKLQVSEEVNRLLDRKAPYGKIIKEIIINIMEVRQYGICIPDKCDSQTITQVFPELIMNDSKCSTKLTNTEWETKAIITMIFLCCILVIAILSTMYDVFIEYSKEKPKHALLVSFSFYTNGKKLLSHSNNPDQLGCLNGLKTLNMMWVIFGHAYFQMFMTGSLDNYFDVYKWLDNEKNMIVLSALLAVDSFLTIGGILTVYTFMRSSDTKLRESFKQIPLLYIHRYLRLTPAYALIILLYGSGLIRYIGNGPKWYALEADIDVCATSYWQNLLYFQNYYVSKNMCVGQSWYLAVDFQLFLLTPFILIPLKKWPKRTLQAMSVLAVVGMIIPFYIGYTNKISGVGLGSANSIWVNDFYFKTHTRFAPYVIGMMFGYFIYKLKHRKAPFVMPISMIICLWVFTIAGQLISIFDGFQLVKDSHNEWGDGFYMGFNKSFWSLSVAVMILLCSTGYGGPINTFLSWPMFQFMAKLSYSMYLIHYMVYQMNNLSARVPTHFSNYVMWTQFFANCVITLMFSILNVLVFESPMAAIIKTILPSRRK